MTEPLFDKSNLAYAQLMLDEYAVNPERVPPEWRTLFESADGRLAAEGLLVPADWSSRARSAVVAPAASPAIPDTPAIDGIDDGILPEISRAAALLQAFRDHGYRLADLDLLRSDPPAHERLSPALFGTSLLASLLLDDVGEDERDGDAMQQLRSIYAGTIGYEFGHLDDPEKVGWLWAKVDSGAHRPELNADEKISLLRGLSRAEGLENFLHRTYLGQKRFSLEGTDALVPMLDLALAEAARAGGREVVVGMAHRGRLNVLTHTVGVSYGELLAEFEGPSLKGGQLDIAGSGDVKYHHGAVGDRSFEGAGSIRVRLAPNPSHLEFVNPVVNGMARALQWSGDDASDERERRTVIPLLIHGDAAFAAEGVVAESLNMARLDGFDVGGTVHVIVNNQIGFTTDPVDARSTDYSSDLAKGYGIPVVHVNADDAEACMDAMRIAMMYRARFGEDFVIDLIGYRRHGHNEGDEPAYTQPLKTARIAEHPTARAIYARKLVDEGVTDAAGVSAIEEEITDELRHAQRHVQEFRPVEDDRPDDEARDPVEPDDTGVAFDSLETINESALSTPEGFTPHPKLWRQLRKRTRDFSTETRIDWGHAEALAFGSLLRDGIPVRLTGQDAQRGTFSHRHLVLHDYETGDTCLPLQGVADTRLEAYNSPLTETAVIGFEYGYSVAVDKDVVIWEAQFGDFVNVAQVMIDQFLSAGLTKWGQYSRLMLLLPHGYEGQGPEHSSARIERFLQLCAEGNMRVALPSTPANYFHLLRRQAKRRPERPMIAFSPKSLLRLPAATSAVEELCGGTFRHVLDDPTVNDPGKVTKLILCSGKFYYDLQAHKARGELGHVAIVRQELLYPWPETALKELLAKYARLTEVVWAQEEPANMGALGFIGPRLSRLLPNGVSLGFASRPERASPSEGKVKTHAGNQSQIVEAALGI